MDSCSAELSLGAWEERQKYILGVAGWYRPWLETLCDSLLPTRLGREAVEATMWRAVISADLKEYPALKCVQLHDRLAVAIVLPALLDIGEGCPWDDVQLAHQCTDEAFYEGSVSRLADRAEILADAIGI